MEVPDDGFTSFIKFTFIYARVGKHEEEELGLGDTPGSLLAYDRGEGGGRIDQLNETSHQNVLHLPSSCRYSSWSCKCVTIITAIFFK